MPYDPASYQPVPPAFGMPSSGDQPLHPNQWRPPVLPPPVERRVFVFFPLIGDDQELIAVDRDTLEMTRRPIPMTDEPCAIAFDGDKIWVASNSNAIVGTEELAVTTAFEPRASIYGIPNPNYSPVQMGMAGVEYGDLSSGLWKTSTDLTGDGSSKVQRIAFDGTITAERNIVIGRFPAVAQTMTVANGFVYVVAIEYIDAVGCVIRVDPTDLSLVVSTGVDLFAYWINIAGPAQVAATIDALWVLAPGDGTVVESSLLRCDVASMEVTSIVCSVYVGTFTGGADADSDGNLWFTSVQPGRGGCISKISQQGTVLATILSVDADTIIETTRLIVDRERSVVWAFVLVLNFDTGAYDNRLLSIDVDTALVISQTALSTHAGPLLGDTCSDMVIGKVGTLPPAQALPS